MYGKAKNYELTESKIISESELKKLIKAIKPFCDLAVKEKTNFHHINDYYLVTIGSLTGLRVSELIGLKLNMINANSLEIIGKGDRRRNVPLGKKGKELVTELIDLKTSVLKHKTGPNEHLFLSRQSKAYTRHGINQRLKKWCQIAGIKSYSYHSLRHYYATYCLNQGFNLAEVQKFLGHSSISITSMYLHFTANTQDKIDSLL